MLFRIIEKFGMFFGRFMLLVFLNFIERVIIGGIKLIVNIWGKKMCC